MKNIRIYFLMAGLLIYCTSCDQNFDEINTNKTSPTAIDPAFQLNNAIINTSLQGLVYEFGIVQQIITPNSGVLTGANYNQDNRNSTDDNWVTYYQNVIKNTRDVIAQTNDDANRSNLMNMARILQANAFLVLTDTYGDIPYDQGGLGYIDQVYYPEYNDQSEIYPKIIQELTEASAGLNASSKIEKADILYGGNLDQWRKFGYSLLLRAGMRLSKVDPATAQQVAGAAFTGGVITTNDDNAIMHHDANYANSIGNTLNATEAANYYLAAPFVDYLKNTNDPRLTSIAVRYVGAKSGPDQQPEIASIDPAQQVGMPIGNDNASIVPVAANLGLASFYAFSQADRRRIAKRDAPYFFVTAAESLLLLAEARQRDWITTGTVEGYYNMAVRAHMEQMATFDVSCTVPAQEIDDYLSANPFDAGNALEQINTQYWIASFMNSPESFANYRRSGFPALAPNPYPGREVTFITRLTYPSSEISVNSENVNAAIAQQGPDKLDTKVWWDK